MTLGKYEINNIYNEDCYEAIKNLPDKCIDLIYIDPPYDYDGGFGTRLTDNKWISDETRKDIKQLSVGIDYNFLDELVRVMKYIRIYIWCNDKQIINYMNYFVNQKNCDYKILTYAKNNPMPVFSRRFLDDCEYCLFFTDKKQKKFQGVDTYQNSFKVYYSSINAKDKKKYNHPTIKPLECVKNHIQKTISEGIVLDCFLGSGTTAVACKELGIDYLGFELDPKYFQVAQDRLNNIQSRAKHPTKLEQTSIFDFIGED